MTRLKVQGLTVRYPRPDGAVHALTGVNLKLSAGEMVGLVGESGSGKTTLLLAILKLLPAPGEVVSGAVCLDGEDLALVSQATLQTYRGRRLAYVPQAASNSLNPVMTVGSQIAEVLSMHTRLSASESRKKVEEVLRMVDLDLAVAHQYPCELSGGMRQRATIAMVLAPGPDVVLADEPTTGLDVLVQLDVLTLLRRIVETLGVSLLLVSHDIRLVARWCDRAAVMYAGSIVEECRASVLLTGPLHPYSRSLVHSLPTGVSGSHVSQPVQGNACDTMRPTTGCSYYTKCPERLGVCASDDPEQVLIDDSRVRCHLYVD